jgi:hypothetical protein
MKKLVKFYKIWQIIKARGHQALVQIFIRYSGKDLGPFVVRAINDAYTSNKLSVTQRSNNMYSKIREKMETFLDVISVLNKMFYDFIWQGNVKIKSSVIVKKNYAEGGLQMINISAFIMALKIT